MEEDSNPIGFNSSVEVLCCITWNLLMVFL